MTGPTWNSPTSLPTRWAAPALPACGRAACSCGLLVRRGLSDGSLAFFSTWCPAGTPVETLVGVEGRRWAIEDAFEMAKTELGLDHNETRSWHGWHRHVSLVMLAVAMMAVVRRRANAMTSPQKSAAAKERGGWCAGRSRRSVA
jgi:SRSO17 transposase